MEVEIFQFVHGDFGIWESGESIGIYDSFPENPLKSLEASFTSWASSAGLPFARWTHPVESTDFDDSKCWRMLSQPKVD
jgi:hypothetical protein